MKIADFGEKQVVFSAFRFPYILTKNNKNTVWVSLLSSTLLTIKIIKGKGQNEDNGMMGMLPTAQLVTRNIWEINDKYADY